MSVEVVDWNSLANEHEFDNIIIGNGASCAIYSEFNYRSLYMAAESDLTPTAIALFEELDTRNFEAVLRALYISSITISSFEQQQIVDDEVSSKVTEEYDLLRETLFETVGEVHIPFMPFQDQQRMHKFTAALSNYKSIFSLNYDLLPYWSFQNIEKYLTVPFPSRTDFFGMRNGELIFCTPSVGASYDIGLYYLHGGIHLWTDALTGIVGKLKNTGAKNILDILLSDQHGSQVKRRKIPLFISEGDSDSKLQAIQSSQYLSFCYHSLMRHASGATVVFGTELGDVDAHIARALAVETKSPVAFSVFHADQDAKQMQARAEELKVRLPYELKNCGRPIKFFNSQTHPLGCIPPYHSQ